MQNDRLLLDAHHRFPFRERPFLYGQDILQAPDVVLIPFRRTPFFSPLRLHIMIPQQDADRLPPYLGHQLSFHRFLGHESHAPSRLTRGRWTAHQGHNR